MFSQGSRKQGLQKREGMGRRLEERAKYETHTRSVGFSIGSSSVAFTRAVIHGSVRRLLDWNGFKRHEEERDWSESS